MYRVAQAAAAFSICGEVVLLDHTRRKKSSHNDRKNKNKD